MVRHHVSQGSASRQKRPFLTVGFLNVILSLFSTLA